MQARQQPAALEADAAGAGRRLRWTVAALAAVALLAPLWLVEFPPLLDYPNHLASAFLVQHLHDPAYRFADFYRVEWRAYPNLLMTLLLLGFGKLMPMEPAGKLMLSLCVLAVPLGAWWFLRAVNPAEERQALWALLLAYNPMFLRGFINYQFSLGLCFCLLAVWAKRIAPLPNDRSATLRPARASGWMAALGLATLLYFTHLGGFAVAAVVMTVWLLAERRWRRLLPTWALFAPGALLYLTVPRIQPLRASPYHYRLDEKLEYLFTPFVGYSTALDYAVCVLAASALVFCWVRNRERRIDRRWLAAVLVLLAVYWFAPADPGASEANRRLMPFVVVLVLAAARLGEKGRVLAAMAVLVFCLRMGDTTYHFFALQPRLREMAQAFEAAPPNARVLPLVENWRDPELVKDSYYHFWGYGVVRRGWNTPLLFARPEIHLLRLNPDISVPRDRVGYQYMSNPDWPAVRRQYDYVWAYGVPQFEGELRRLGRPAVSAGMFELVRIEK